MSAMLELRGLRKAFGARVLFDIDRLTLDAGKAYVLTGVNGAGKSTLLRVLAGLDSAACADLQWQGRALALAPYPAAMRARTVYVHQHPVLFSTSVAHNVAYGLLARGTGKAHAAHGRRLEAVELRVADRRPLRERAQLAGVGA